MYCRLLTEVKSISSSVWNADRTSSVSLRRASGLVVSKYVTPESKVAVVSDPAIINREAFILSFPTENSQQSYGRIGTIDRRMLLTIEVQIILLPQQAFDQVVSLGP